MSAPRHRACPVCGASVARPFLNKGRLTLVRCTDCAMVRLDPLPEGIDDAYYSELGQPYYLSPDKLVGDFAEVRFERELALLDRWVPGGDLLDVGCSTGAFLHQVRRRWPGRFRGVGLEVSHAAVEHARGLGLDVIGESLLTHDFGARRFDVVTFWAVLEHLSDPGACVAQAVELLRPDAVCVALVPNLQSIALRSLGARYRYVLDQHLNYFSAATLARLMTSRGLQVIAAGGSHFNPAVLWQDWRRRSDAAVPEQERAALLRRTTRWKQSAAMAPARVLLRGFERVLAMAGGADNLWVVARRT